MQILHTDERSAFRMEMRELSAFEGGSRKHGNEGEEPRAEERASFTIRELGGRARDGDRGGAGAHGGKSVED